MRDVAQSWRSVARDVPVTYEMASPINRQLSGPITIILPLGAPTRRQGGRAYVVVSYSHSSVDPVSRSSAWSMKRGQTGSSSPSSSSSSSSSSSIDACRIDPREGQTSQARCPPRLLRASGRFGRVHSWTPEAARNRDVISSARTGRPKKGCNTIEGGRAR